MEWREFANSWILVPPNPIAVLHFLGGAFVAAVPQVTYQRLLRSLAYEGYAIVATPFVNTFDHRAIARAVLSSFEQTYDYLYDSALRRKALPIYGIGHSMGCKLHLLIGSLFDVERAGNILMSFNNFPVAKAIPFGEALSSFEVEFTPSPKETMALAANHYAVRRNLLIKFNNDEIDQTLRLQGVLQQQFSDMVSVQRLAGNHLTPLGPDVKWQPGAAVSPLDMIAQWMRQSLYYELEQLERTLLLWLDPLSVFDH
jgi:hypothetical protein